MFLHKLECQNECTSDSLLVTLQNCYLYKVFPLLLINLLSPEKSFEQKRLQENSF